MLKCEVKGITKPLYLDSNQLMMLIMSVERPLVEEPLVPEERDDPPEIPDEGFTAYQSSSNLVPHVRIAQSPVPEVYIVEEIVIYDRQYEDTKSSEPEASPGIHILRRRHIVKVVVPLEERNQGHTGDLSRMYPQEARGVSLIPRGQMVHDIVHVRP